MSQHPLFSEEPPFKSAWIHPFSVIWSREIKSYSGSSYVEKLFAITSELTVPVHCTCMLLNYLLVTTCTLVVCEGHIWEFIIKKRGFQSGNSFYKIKGFTGCSLIQLQRLIPEQLGQDTSSELDIQMDMQHQILILFKLESNQNQDCPFLIPY